MTHLTDFTTAALIRAEADVIERHGYISEYGDDLLTPRESLTSAARKVIAGDSTTLTTAQAACLAGLLNDIETDLGCSIGTWERVHARDSRDAVVKRLRVAATRFDLKLTVS